MKHNHGAIVTAILYQMLLSFVWYSEALFLNTWKDIVGHTGPENVFVQPHPVVASLLGSAMFCYLLSWIFQLLVINDWLRGLIVGSVVGLGFLAPTLATHYLYIGFGPELVWIDCSQLVLSAAGAGMILATWQGEETPEAV